DRFLRRSLIMPRDQLPGARNREGAWAPRAGAGTDRRGVAGHCGGGGAAERAGAEDASAVTPGVAAGRNRDGAGRPVPAMGVGGGGGAAAYVGASSSWWITLLISSRTVSWTLRSSRRPRPTWRPTSGSRFGPKTSN